MKRLGEMVRDGYMYPVQVMRMPVIIESSGRLFLVWSSEEECGRMKMEIGYAQHQPISTRVALES